MKDSLPEKDPKILQIMAEIETSLKDLLGDNLVKIILYGSYARNDQDAESDIDIMVLVNAEESISKGCREKFNDLTFALSLKYDLLVSMIIKNYREYNQYRVCKIKCVNSLLNILKLKQGEKTNELIYRRTNQTIYQGTKP